MNYFPCKTSLIPSPWINWSLASSRRFLPISPHYLQSLALTNWLFIFALTGILALFLWTLELLSYSSKHWNSSPIFINIGILFLSFQTLKFQPFFYTHWNSDPVLLILQLWSYPSKHWNSGPISMSIGVIIFSSQTLEFWSYFYTHWIANLILSNIAILILSFHTLEF